jgi:hypothetical protein
MFFPNLFDDSDEFQARLNRKERLINMCDVMLSENEKEREEYSKKLLKTEMQLLNLFKPKNFIGAESYEVAFEKNFQMLCHSLNSHTNENVKKMTVLEAYSLMEMLKTQNKNNE